MINIQCKVEYRRSNGYAVLPQTRVIQEPVRRISAEKSALHRRFIIRVRLMKNDYVRASHCHKDTLGG